MYTKFQSSMETHRNWMTTFRADVSYSSLYALQEKVFLSICNDKKETQVFSMVKKEKELLDTFMYALNTGLN